MKDKYFKINREYSSIRESYIRYNKRYQVDISNTWCGRGIYIEANISRKMAKDEILPESSQYESVRKILEDDYQRAYNMIFANIQQFSPQNCECYCIENSINFIELYAYTLDSVKPRACCHIDIRDLNDSIICSISLGQRFSTRPESRKKGIPTTGDTFAKVKALVMEYLYDASSFTVLLEKFLSQFRQLALVDDTPLQPLNPVADFSAIVEQIKSRKDVLCRELIELDESKEKRIKIRAEIAGLDYALRVIDMKGQL